MTIVAFTTNIPPGQPDPELVAEIERRLEEAKSGALRGIAYATVKIGDVTGTGWAGCGGSKHLLSSAVLMLHHRYAAALLEAE